MPPTLPAVFAAVLRGLKLAADLWKAPDGTQEQAFVTGVRWGTGIIAAFDEMTGRDGGVRPAYGELSRWLQEVPPDVLDFGGVKPN